ncbi:MGMT family protein [Propioniciclava sp. MC1595]|uniref:MGMT family protein n=1 Tax=Propioniciclava sp. MC1595 TaxID=2760308 RepID=UPI0016623EAB|nr:MGMT family protein [Propioniciclava sp. MC1595]MBB1496084.1 MGMT family protein [Propioniciclava sp. MC1595]QTE26790.1 MGMT family protein [Propioniciclava sp. MC1595]
MPEQPDAVPGPVERVRLAVSLVPRGRVASYGDIGALTGVGPRQVGAIMRDASEGWPWWRIVSHDGTLAPVAHALEHWADEGIVVRPDGRGCRMRTHRADLADLAAEYRFAAVERGWNVATD